MDIVIITHVSRIAISCPVADKVRQHRIGGSRWAALGSSRSVAPSVFKVRYTRDDHLMPTSAIGMKGSTSPLMAIKPTNRLLPHGLMSPHREWANIALSLSDYRLLIPSDIAAFCPSRLLCQVALASHHRLSKLSRLHETCSKLPVTYPLIFTP